MASFSTFPSNLLIRKTRDLFQTNRPSIPVQIEKKKCKEDATLDCMHPINEDIHFLQAHFSGINQQLKCALYNQNLGRTSKTAPFFKIFLDSLQRDSRVGSTQKVLQSQTWQLCQKSIFCL